MPNSYIRHVWRKVKKALSQVLPKPKPKARKKHGRLITTRHAYGRRYESEREIANKRNRVSPRRARLGY